MDAGPEYKVIVYPNSDGFDLGRLDEFGQVGTRVPCPGLRATADAFGEDLVGVSIPRSCIGYPASVRVSVRARYDSYSPGVVDWAPAERMFFAAVTQ